MGPPSHKNRDALNVLPIAPWIKPPKTFAAAPREIDDVEVDALFNAIPLFKGCSTLPKHLDEEMRPLFWKAFIVFASSTAFRKGVLLGLKWDDVTINKQRVIVPSNIDKCRRERRKPLHSEVYRLLEAIRFNDKLLHWPHGNAKFYEIWHGLNDFAGISPHILPHDLKRYALQLACRSGVDAATLQTLGDHSALKTTLNHYAQGNLAGYVEKFRLPGSGGGADRRADHNGGEEVTQ